MKYSFYLNFIIISFALNSCGSDDNIRQQFADDTRLKWEQFKGIPPTDSILEVTALTAAQILVECDDGEYVDTYKSCSIECFFDESLSWIRKERVFDTAHLLEHESGHYRLALIQAKKLNHIIKLAFSGKPTSQANVDEIISKAKNDFDNEQLLYDTETDHSKNTQIQMKWDSILIEDLIRYYKRPSELKLKKRFLKSKWEKNRILAIKDLEGTYTSPQPKNHRVPHLHLPI